MAKRKKNNTSVVLGAAVILFVAVLSISYALSSRRQPDMIEDTTNTTTEEITSTEPVTQPATEEQTQTLAPTTEKAVAPSTEPQTKEVSADPLPVPAAVTITESNWNLVLVNLYYKMPDDYKVTLAPCIPGSDVKLDYRVAEYYEKMYNAAKADGITLTPYSGYRSKDRQNSNFNRKIDSYISQGYSPAQAKVLAAQSIMPPGCSEHNLGLAMDIAGTDANFYKTAAYKWLMENAADYGFILRYPEDKVHITKVKYEPWHWRYVGVEAAKAMKASGQCLEEYLGKLPPS